MQVGFGANLNINSASKAAFNVVGINQGLQQEQKISPENESKKRDRVTISPQGKMMNTIENLMKQKENVIQQKSELMTKTLEKGKSMETIEVQLELYEEQLANIDEQIAQTTANMAKSVVEQPEEKKSEQTDENKTEEQAETEHLSMLASTTDDLKHAKIVSSVKNQAQGEVNVKKAEIKIAEIDIDRLVSAKKVSGGDVDKDPLIWSAKKAVKLQKADLSEMTDRLGNLEALQKGTIENNVEGVEKLRESGETQNEEKNEAENGTDAKPEEA